MSHSAASYFLLAWAIENRVSLSCLYGGQPRIFCPIILGLSLDGEQKVLAYQFGGRMSAGRLRKPNWKCFRVAGLSRIEIIRGEWQAGARHSQRQTCVEIVDYDVNEDSPYAPRHSLGVLQGEPCPPGEDSAA
jgi:hypothetical protein